MFGDRHSTFFCRFPDLGTMTISYWCGWEEREFEYTVTEKDDSSVGSEWKLNLTEIWREDFELPLTTHSATLYTSAWGRRLVVPDGDLKFEAWDRRAWNMKLCCDRSKERYNTFDEMMTLAGELDCEEMMAWLGLGHQYQEIMYLYQDGYQRGTRDGTRDGYQSGYYQDGYHPQPDQDGYQDGYSDGYHFGYQQGHQHGCQHGYEEMMTCEYEEQCMERQRGERSKAMLQKRRKCTVT